MVYLCWLKQLAKRFFRFFDFSFIGLVTKFICSVNYFMHVFFSEFSYFMIFVYIVNASHKTFVHDIDWLWLFCSSFKGICLFVYAKT